MPDLNDIAISKWNGTKWAETVRPESDYTSNNFGVAIDGLGLVISAGPKGNVMIPFTGTITKWFLSADQSGDIVFDLKLNGSYIVGGGVGGNSPMLDSQLSNSAEPSDWIATSVTEGDVVEFEIASGTVNNITKATLVLKCS
jgi:hypothetical protein